MTEQLTASEQANIISTWNAAHYDASRTITISERCRSWP